MRQRSEQLQWLFVGYGNESRPNVRIAYLQVSGQEWIILGHISHRMSSSGHILRDSDKLVVVGRAAGGRGVYNLTKEAFVARSLTLPAS